MVHTFMTRAQHNLARLMANSYPGRGMVIGMDQSAEHFVQVYWLQGRSTGSRNRRLEVNDAKGAVWTELADPNIEQSTANLLYDAMIERRCMFGQFFAVSNGIQTKKAARFNGLSLDHNLANFVNELDKPNFTPRITARLILQGNTAGLEMLILKRHSQRNPECVRQSTVHHIFHPGIGYCLHTYAGDAPEGVPVPSFVGSPYFVPIEGGIDEVIKTFWGILSRKNRVSIAVKFISRQDHASEIRVINRYKKVPLRSE